MNSQGRWRAHQLPSAILLLLATLITAERFHTRDEPLEWDITFYAVAGHEMLTGRKLYSDLWDNRPPGTNVTFAAAELLLGYGRQAVYLLGIGAAVATLLGVYAAGTALGGSRASGLWAAGLWAIVASDLPMEANHPNTEVFLNAAQAWGLALMAKRGRNFGFGSAALTGAVLALPTFYKPYAAVSALLLGLAHIAAPPQGECRRRAVTEVGVMLIVALAAWGAFVAYFAMTGRLSELWRALVVYNVSYAGASFRGMLANLISGVSPTMLAFSWSRIARELAPIALAGTLICARSRARSAALLVAFAIASQVEVALPGRFYHHYFQLWLPVLVIAAGLAAAPPPQSRWALKFAGSLAGCIVIMLLARTELRYFRKPAKEWSRAKFGSVYLGDDAAAREIDALLEPGETFHVWGSHTALYLATRRSPPAGVLFASDLYYGPFARALSDRQREKLESAPPELLVIVKHELARGEHPLLSWLETRYCPLPRHKDPSGFSFLALRGGKLEMRWKAYLAAGRIPSARLTALSLPRRSQPVPQASFLEEPSEICAPCRLAPDLGPRCDLFLYPRCGINRVWSMCSC